MHKMSTFARAEMAARRMHATRDLYWHEQAVLLREAAGRARTNRAMTRLLAMAKYSEIQAEIGFNINQAEADREWATYRRQGL